MSQTSFRSKLTTGIVLLILCFVSAYFLATPYWNKYSTAKSQLDLTNDQITQLNQSLSLVDNFVKSYEDNRSYVGLTNQALPPKNADTAGFVSSLNSLAEASGVVLGDMQLEEQGSADRQAQPNSIQAVRISLSATGTFLAYKDFILRLENHLRLVDIQKVTLASDDSGLLRYQMILMTYYQK